ncbi:MAG: VOC family protein [Balneolaceae bacterium]
MATMNTYLNFAGNTEEAFNFYRSVFGGEFKGGINRFGDTPEADKIPENERDKVMHIALPIGNGNVLMGTDALESMGQTLTQGNNYYISLHPESMEEAEKLYKGLSAGGAIETELQKVFWGAYFGSFTDKFGVKWMVNYDVEQ